MKKIALRVVSTLAVAGGLASQAALAAPFVYNNFNDVSDMQLNGSATTATVGPNDVLRLTSTTSQGGSAFVETAITLNSNVSFSSAFSFQISDPVGWGDEDGVGADGLVFVVQTVANNVGGIGGGIGYQGINNSVGIEFDTWNNGSWDDNNGNHVGINLNGSIDSVLQSNINTTSPGRLNNGAVWHAWVDYNGVLDSLEVRLSTTTVRPTLALLTYSVDLTGVLGSPNAFVGFTSGTGAAGGKHDILNWSFADDYQPFGVPEPTSISMLGLGVAALAFARKRRA